MCIRINHKVYWINDAEVSGVMGALRTIDNIDIYLERGEKII